MRAKYKIGNLVQLKDDSTGVIDCVITYEDRFEYGIAGKQLSELTVPEDKIVAAFRPVKTKATSGKKKVVKRAPKPVDTEEDAA